MIVIRRIEWDMGHRLPSHQGKCSQLHGHRYAAEVAIEGPVDAATGMVIDFFDLDHLLKRWVDRHDHKFLMHDKDWLLKDGVAADAPGLVVVAYIPTAENIGTAFRDFISKELSAFNPALEILEVKVWETPKSMAVIV